MAYSNGSFITRTSQSVNVHDADMFLNRPIAIEILWINKDIVSKIDQLMMMANRFFLCVSDTAVSSTSIGRCKIKAKAERTEVEERERQANRQR